MKNFLAAFVLVLTSLISQAQVAKRSFVTFSLMAPTPVGSYRSTDPYNDRALFAKGGMGFGIEGAYMFHPYMGVGAMVAGISNKLNEEAFSGAMEQVINDKQGEEVHSTTKTSPHWVQTAMLGLYGSYPMKRLSLDVKALGGFLSYQFPNIQISSSNGDKELVQKMNANNATSFGFNAGLGARIRLTEHLAFRAMVEYLQGSADLTIFQSAVYNEGATGVTGQGKYSFTISMVNFGVGLAYQINNEK